MIKIEVETRRAERALRSIPEQSRLAMRRAIQRTGTSTRTETRKVLRSQRLNIKASVLNRQVQLVGRRDDQITVRATGAPVPIQGLSGTRGTKKRGVSYRVRANQPLQRLRHAFVARMASGHVGVFVREGQPRTMQSGSYKGKRRQPIREVYTLSAGSAFAQELPTLAPRALAILERNYLRDLDFRLNLKLQPRGIHYGPFPK